MLTKENYKQQYLKIGICVLIGILIKLFVPVCYDLTPKGVTYLAVFVSTVLLWTFVDTGWPTILCFGLFMMFNIMPAASVLSASIGNPVPYAVMSAGVIVGIMNQHGVMTALARWFISRKIVHGHPYVFLALWGIVLFFSAAILGTILGFLVLMPLVLAICKEIGYEKGTKFHLAVCMYTVWVGIFAESVLCFLLPTSITGVGVMTGIGFAWTTMDLMKSISIPVAVVSILSGILVIKFLVRPDMSNFVNFDDARIRAELKANPIDKVGRICIAAYLFIIIFSSVLPALKLGAISTWAAQVTSAGFVLICVAAMSLIMVDGKPIGDVAKDGALIPWKPMIFITGTFLFSGTIASADYGIITTLTQVLAPITSKLPVAVVVLAGAIVAVVLTNVMSNVVTCFIVVSVFVPVLMTMGVSSSMAQACGALFIALCSLACVTPSASPGVGLVLGVEYQMKDSVKFSIAFVVIAFILTVATVLPLGNIVYN